ncbi:MAG: hypothetical protein EXR70_04990 [Deltaproteobacteria bacterium]|nr:hypothetical protein [Deltaproteobacteria bacterium]
MHRDKIIFSLTLALLLSGSIATAAQQRKPLLTPARIPLTAKSPRQFVPAGWTIEEQIVGDLNRDSLPDVVLKLVQSKTSNSAADAGEKQRALIILFRGKNDQWRRAAIADRLLQCVTCGGALYGVKEAPAHVAIDKGILIVKQDHGSRNVVDQTFRFRHDKKIGKFLLIELDRADRDRANGELIEQHTDFLTGLKTASKSRYDEAGQKFVVKSSARTKVAKSRIPIEQVDHQKY